MATVALIFPHAVSAQQSFDQIRRGVVRVGTKTGTAAPSWFGTGLIVDDQCTFLTAKHVLKTADRTSLAVGFQIPDARDRMATIPVTLLFEDAREDLLFLRAGLTVSGKPCRSGAPMHIFRLAQNLPLSSLIGASVSILGFPVLAGAGGTGSTVDIPVLRKGHIAATELLMINGRRHPLLLDLTGVPGFSGSPIILDSTGEVIGVILGPGPTQRIFGFEWATATSVADYMSAKGISLIQ